MMRKKQSRKKYNRRIQKSAIVINDREMVRSSLTMLGFLAIFGCIGLVTWITGKIADPNTLPIKQLKLEGEFRHLNTATLKSLIADNIDGGFFTLNVDQIRSAVTSTPWVREATVRKLWPDTVYVKIKEQSAIVRWGDSGFLNYKGELFEPKDDLKPDGLIVLNGPSGTEKLVFQKYKILMGLLNPKKRSIEWLKLNQRRGWSFAIKDGPTVIVGRKDVDERLWKYVIKVEASLGEGINKIAQVDLRYTNGFTVREISSEIDPELGSEISTAEIKSNKKIDNKVERVSRGT